MKIGFDAKRAFYNSRGLGCYSRDVIRLLSDYYSENQYFLYTPKTHGAISFPHNESICQVRAPQGLHSWGPFSSLWRTKSICSDIQQDQLDIYHGLSHELPYGIEKTGTHTVVTMHDLIFLKNPELFPLFDRYSFRKKYTHGASVADRIIAISEETKSDLINYLGEKEERIDVVYQGYSTVFRNAVTDEQKRIIKTKYNLPDHFMLIICAIERRKNHELILKAMRNPQVELPLVIAGNPSQYKETLLSMIHEYQLDQKVFFIGHVETSDLPPLYQLADIFVYPSLFEGFGRPILESLVMGTPVITSKGSCFQETGGKAARYVSCDDDEELANTIIQITSDESLRKTMIEESYRHAANFSDEKIAAKLMETYKKIV